MYRRDYDTGDADMCPHSTFSGCNCYDEPETVADASDSYQCGSSSYNPRWSVDEYECGQASARRDTEYRASDDPNVWITGGGAAKRIEDMADEHLANALGKQVHYHGIRHPRTRAMLAELTRRTRGVESAPPPKACSLHGDTAIKD